MDRRFIRIIIETERTMWIPRVAESSTNADGTPPSRTATEPESPSAAQLETTVHENSLEKDDIA